jgi:hypothetical protein
MVPPMRRTVTLVVLALCLMLPAGLPAASAHEPRAGSGLVVGFRTWGKLHLGMTAKAAQSTGMVTHQVDRCAGGFLLAKRLRERGTLVWSITSKATRIHEIVVSGTADHTAKGIHPGSTLSQLRKAYPKLSKVHRSSFVTGSPQQGKKDFHIAFVKRKFGTMTFQWDFGPAPKPGTPIDRIVVERTPDVFFGC